MNSNGRMGLKIYPGETIENQINFMDVSMLQREDHDSNLTCSTEGLSSEI